MANRILYAVTKDSRVNQLMPGPGEIVVGGPNGPVKRLTKLVARNPGLSPLTTYHQALANVANAPLDILCVGDSITEGNLLTARSTRWIEILQTRLRARWQPAGIPGGLGYTPSWYKYNSFPTFAYSGTTSLNTNNGLGRRTMNLTNGTATITFSGTRAWVLYSTGASGSPFTVTVDGGTPINATAHNSSTGGVSTVGNKVNTGALTAGDHTLVVASSGAIYLEGIMAFNGDETAGIRTWDGAVSGAAVSFFLSGAWLADVTLIQPKLVTIMLGSNDVRSSVDPATYKTQMQTLIANIRGACTSNPSIVILVAPDPVFADAAAYPNVPYISAMYDLIAADPTLALCDLTQRLGANGQARGIVQTDNIHINALGHAMVGNALAGFLEP